MLLALPRFAVMLHVAFLAGYLAWARGGTLAGLYSPLPWLALGLLEMVILFPTIRRGETDGMARMRTFRSILRDPVLYLGLALLTFLAFQYLNSPRILVYDVESGIWNYSPPPLPGWPFSVAPLESRQLLYWFGIAYAAILAVRHGLSKRAKLNLLRVLVLNGALLALLGVIQMASGTSSVFWHTPLSVQFFASFGYPNHAGAYFTLLFAVSGGLLLHAMSDRESSRHIWWLAVCLVLNLLGATLSLSRAGIMLSWAVLVVGLGYGISYLWPLITGAAKLRTMVFAAVSLGMAAFFFFVAYPQNPVRREMASLTSWKSFQGSLWGDRQVLVETAWRVWKDYPWSGVGGWGFRRYVGLYLDPSQWDQLRSHGRANVHNDFMQFLCEHGTIGVGLMLGTIFVLLVPIFVRLVGVMRTPPIDEPVDRPFLHRVSPVVLAILLGTTCTVAHSMIDLPFRSPAILVTWVICLATVPALLPKPKKVVATRPSASAGRPVGHRQAQLADGMPGPRQPRIATPWTNKASQRPRLPSIGLSHSGMES